MSWFGDTFGDSLNSLKGQITKITKEVLTDDAASGNEKKESESPSVKELIALCESKDLEIASLRAEFNKLHDQYQSEIVSVNGSDETKPSKVIYDNDNLHIKKLESELVELREERDHLNSCLDELQLEHQSNLNEVISLTDKYKSELEELKIEHSAVKSKLTEALGSVSAKENREAEVNSLNARIKELQLQVEKEKEKSASQKEAESQTDLKEQLNKLSVEVKELNNSKQKTEKDRERLQIENEELKNKLSEQVKENTENGVKLKLLVNEREELKKHCQNQEFLESNVTELISNKAEVQKRLQSLLQLLNLNTEDDRNMIEMIALIENNFLEKCNEVNKTWKGAVSDLELELKNLKEENEKIQEKLKMSVEKEADMERKHKEEMSSLKSSLSDMKNQEQDCMHQSQTDDVKRLEQEIAHCMSSILVKDNEITNYSESLQKLEGELRDLKESSLKIEEELKASKMEKKNLQEEIEKLKNFSLKINQEKAELEEREKVLQAEKENLDQINHQLKSKSNELEKQVAEVSLGTDKFKKVEGELQKMIKFNAELEKRLKELQNENSSLKNDCEYAKAQGIVKESSITELMKANTHFQDKVAELQSQCNALLESEAEKEKWKEASINLQIQIEDLIEKKEEVESECLKLKSQLQGLAVKDAEIEQLKSTNSNLMKSCNELHQQLENKAQEEQFSTTKETELEEKYKSQLEVISQLQEENSELKCRIQKFQQELKAQMLQPASTAASKDEIQQHRRSRSAAEMESHVLYDVQGSGAQGQEQLAMLNQALQQEQAKYQLLQQHFQETSNKEASARKELERLRLHLIEVEDHYTEEAVENEKLINDLKSKLVAAEEQLQNSSTLYTSLKVRDNQHLESLQSQIRMLSAQRDDFQSKLSAAEDEVQKHKASLMSLQIVLEQFQQDKEREIEQVAMEYEKQLQSADERFRNLELEMEVLRNQLTEAKNGLKAASRLGEQLEKKSKQVTELEEKQNELTARVAELEESLAVANQGNNGKVDKSLIKNLVVGYVLSPNVERKSQVLRIMASVLDFSQEERNKMGVDANRSGWLSNILHPKGEGPPNNQSLSEAFIKFLENESRPQPQLKLLPEQLQPSSSGASRASPKPSGRLSELTLPTFNSSQDNDSSIILKNVLKDS